LVGVGLVGDRGEGERESIILGSNFCSLYGFNSL